RVCPHSLRRQPGARMAREAPERSCGTSRSDERDPKTRVDIDRQARDSGIRRALENWGRRMRILSFVETNPAHVIFLQGRHPVLIDELVQYHTYRGLILGTPEDRINEAIPSKAAEYAKSCFGTEAAPVVIPHTLHSFSVEQQQKVRKPGGDFEPAGD